MSKIDIKRDVGAAETVDVYHFQHAPHLGGRIVYRILHRIDADGGVVETVMFLSREKAEWVRDQLTVALNETDAAYQTWLASKQPKALGVGPLDVEDPGSRFAATEPLPVMTAPKGEPMFPIYETGAPPTHREWTDRLVISESYADDARDEERRS